MTKLIPILSGKAMIVELPPEWTHEIQPSFGINHDYLWYIVKCENERFHAKDKFFKLPPGNWRIIGMLSEVREQQASEIVGFFQLDQRLGYANYVSDYPSYPFTYALESLESAILAEGYYLNEDELEAPNRLDFGYYEDFDAEGHLNGAGWGTDDGEQKYHEAIDKFIADQSRVLDRSRCLLLGRVDA